MSIRTRIQTPDSSDSNSLRPIGFFPLTICASSATGMRLDVMPAVASFVSTVAAALAGTRKVSRRLVSSTT